MLNIKFDENDDSFLKDLLRGCLYGASKPWYLTGEADFHPGFICEVPVLQYPGWLVFRNFIFVDNFLFYNVNVSIQNLWNEQLSKRYETFKTRVKLILNFPRPHAITCTNKCWKVCTIEKCIKYVCIYVTNYGWFMTDFQR